MYSYILSVILTHHIAVRVLASSQLGERMQMLNLLPPPRLVFKNTGNVSPGSKDRVTVQVKESGSKFQSHLDLLT